MVQYEVIACSAPCQGSSQQTPSSPLFFFFTLTAVLSCSGTAQMSAQMLFYLCASCYDNVTSAYAFAFHVRASVGLRVFVHMQSLPPFIIFSVHFSSHLREDEKNNR